MSTDDNDFIAMPPPGAPAEIETTDATSAAETDETDFISLPPGIALDSGTFKVPARTPPSREPALDIVFVPTVIGATPVLPDPVAEPAPIADPASVTGPVGALAPPAPLAAPVGAPAPPTSPVAVATPAPVWRLTLPDGGATIALDAAVLIGRNPAASAVWPQAALLPVDDLTKSVSKTHALLEIDGGVLWVHDLDSTNGVYVVVGDDVVEVVPGTRAAVPAGAELELGEFVTHVTFE